MTEELRGKDFIALRRLSDADNNTIADVGETCERVPAAKAGGTVSDALARLLASGKIDLLIPGQTRPAPEAAGVAGAKKRRVSDG